LLFLKKTIMSNLIPKTIFNGLANPFTRKNDLFNFEDSFFENLKSVKTNYGENKDEFFIHLQAPGFSKEDLSVNFEEDTITVSASVEKKSDVYDGDFYRKDFTKSAFKKSFLLPENIDKDGIKAELKNGILNLSIPKTKKEGLPEAKKIQIEVK
jgi:HSP20 family protein